MKRLRLLAVAAVSAIACRGSELIAPHDRSLATGAHPMSASAPTTEKFAAYLSDAGTNSVLVVGQASHDTIKVISLGAAPGASATSPDGARVYVVLGAVQQLAVIRTSDNTVLANVPLGGSGAAGVVVSPDNKTVYVANRGGTISVVDATALQVVASIPISGISPFMLDVTPDGSHLYVGDDAAYYVAVVNTGTRVVERIVAVGFRPYGVDVSDDGQFVYVATRDGAVSRLRTATNAVDLSFGFPGTPMGLAIAPGSQHVFVGVHDKSLVRVLNVPTGQWIATVTVANALLPKVTSDGLWVYVSEPESGVVTVLDAQTFAVAATIQVTNPSGLSFAPVTPPTQPTTTAIASSAQPSLSGQMVQFTATVTSGNTPVTIGSVSFRLGGTSCADAVTFAGPVSLDANGKATGSRTFTASGSPFTVRACYDGTTTASQFLSSEAAVTQNVNSSSTTTGITSSAQPSLTGQMVQFTATVTNANAPVTVGSVNFRLGGTTCADATTFAGPVSLDANGKATTSRTFRAAGSPFVVRACYDGATSASQFQSSEGVVTQTVNPARIGVSTAVGASTQQYSDQVVLTAQLGLEAGALDGLAVTGTVSFSFAGQPAGSVAVNAATLPVTVTLTPPQTVNVPAGTYAVAAAFTSSSPNFASGSATGATATIIAEDAVVTAGAAFPTAVRVASPFGTTGPISFAFTASELWPETNADQSLTHAGDLTHTAARAVFTPSGGGISVTVDCTGGSVTGSGYGQVRPFTCASSGLPSANYQVALQLIATSAGSYYVGSQAPTLRVYDPSAETIALDEQVSALVDRGLLKPGNANALSMKLDEVVAKIARRDDNAAINQLGAFMNQVRALKLPADVTDQLIRAAQAIVADLTK